MYFFRHLLIKIPVLRPMFEVSGVFLLLLIYAKKLCTQQHMLKKQMKITRNVRFLQ